MFQRVAVIGAGPSGVTSIKGCLDEGLEPTCFESSDDIGGLWRFKEKPEPGRANIYKSVIINSSKEMMSFSDFPPPADLSNNMHHSEVLLHLRLYAQTFNLLPHIRFQTTVISVRQTTNFEVPGQWEVETESREGQRETRVFDAVMVCTGHFTQPHLPLRDFPIESFRAKYFHSWEYCSAEGLEGKRVVVIGIGNSGGDIAVDVSRVAEKLYLSTRRGAWILNRVWDNGIPVDLFSNRATGFLRKNLPFGVFCSLRESRLNKKFDHALYNLKPRHVFATGYQFSFPFLASQVVSVSNNKASLYKYVFPPELEHPTLAIIGLVQPLGSIMAISKLQARWATRVFKCIKLPSLVVMLKDIQWKQAAMAQYVTSQRHTIQVDYVSYMDEVAELVGVQPNIPRMLLTDPKLGMNVLFGPCTPYQYRLRGPGKWAGARQAILTQRERVTQPMQTRQCDEPKPRRSYKWPLLLSAAALSFTVYVKRNNLPAFLQDPASLLDRVKI
uniref:Flavin-containing monooxygenase n=1 Tax=Pundamilia nyererei TaxID=303518 RepID=A0A3B4FI44_9CICH